MFRNDSQKDTNTIGQQVKKVHVSLYWQGSLQNFQNQPKKENQQGRFYQLWVDKMALSFHNQYVFEIKTHFINPQGRFYQLRVDKMALSFQNQYF